MQNFEYCTPTRLVFGKGVIKKLPEVLGAYGHKVLLTYGGGSIKKIGLYQEVILTPRRHSQTWYKPPQDLSPEIRNI